MKKIMSALVVAGVMVFGYGVNAEGTAPKADKADKAAKVAAKGDKFLAQLKELDAAKYAEVNAIADAKAKSVAAKKAVVDIKLAELKKSDEAKYNELTALKTSDIKKYNAEVNKLLSPGKAAKK